MRILSLIPLALMLSFIFAGCAEQLPHQPASVIGDPESVNRTGDTVLGGGFEIPGLDLNPVPGEGSCHVQVRLVAVYYGGTYIGPSWKLNGTVNHRTWSIGPRKLEHKKWNLINSTILDHESKNCFPHLFFFHACARQVDRPASDEGTNSGMAGIICPPQGANRYITVPVIVEGTPWPQPFWGKRKAEMRLAFTISTECKTP